MKVKSCYLAKFVDSEEDLKEYTEELGCTIRHRFVPTEDCTVYTIEDATGNKSVVVVLSKKYQTLVKGNCGLRLVVDNINEGIDYFKAKGYKVFVDLVESESNFSCAMEKDGEYRLIFEHKQH